jgi:alkanesulfonate monooxygenase SsuD/methylene tetrahydromethanopterin reductase-like flavin-dependent oxidoreductase (luciferase family)
VLTPTGTWCEDAWLTTAALLSETSRLKFLVAFRPGFLSPTLAVQMAATYQRHSGGRLLLNVVTGGDIEEQRRFGDWLDHDQRYERTGEFLTVLRDAWSGRPFDFTGTHYRDGVAAAGSGAGGVLRGRVPDRLEIYPNLRAGYGLVRAGAGTALVGSHEEVADRIEEYHELGLDHFILSGQPHLEEAYWFGENVLPLLRRRGLLAVDEPEPPGDLRAAS